MSADAIKQQVARLKRAAKKTPLVVSAVSGDGVAEVLRALLKVIEQARHSGVEAGAADAAWHPLGGVDGLYVRPRPRRLAWRRGLAAGPRPAARRAPPRVSPDAAPR